MAVLYIFGSATSAIPLSQLDSNFATTITLGNTAIQLGNTVTTLNNMTLANVTISSASSNAQLRLERTTTSAGHSYLGASSTSLLEILDSSFATRLTFDSAGNLGLGVTPSASSVPTFQAGIAIVVGNNETDVTSNAYYNSGWKYVGTGLATQYQANSGLHKWFTAPSGTAGNAISFTQAMTLDASGNLLVGKTALAYNTVGCAFEALGTLSATRSADFSGVFNRTTSDGGVVQFRRDSTAVGSISVTASATAYNTSSDYRLKNITGPITTSGSYIDSLNPVEGTWKADGSTFVGLIAHEVQEASRTQVATGTKDGSEMQGMDYSNAELIANLIAEIQSLRKRLASAGI